MSRILFRRAVISSESVSLFSIQDEFQEKDHENTDHFHGLTVY